MKKFALLFLFFVTTSLFAQENNFESEVNGRDVDKNEVSLNAFNILAFGVLDFSYERILTPHSSLEAAIFSNALRLSKGEEADLDDVYNKDFSLTGTYKYFFSERKTAWGFYTGIFGMVSSGDNEVQVEYSSPTGSEYRYEDQNYTDFALGVGLGYKYVAKEGFMIDLSFGLGRNLFNVNSPNLVISSGINFGYRF